MSANGPREGGRDFDRDRGGFDRDRGGYGRDREERSGGVKARMRAKARKKARKTKRRMFQRRKVCRFCVDSNLKIHYKDAKTLRLFTTETGKMIPRRISGNCAKHQRPLALAIKRARHLALLPYAEHGL